MRNAIYFIVSFMCLYSSIISIHIEDCGSQLGKFTNVTISSCNGAEPVCNLKRNTNVTLNILFTTSATDTAVKVDVHGVIQGIPVPWPVHNPNACESSGLTCPLKPGQNYNYTATFPVLKAYPKIHLNVKWELKNQEDKDIVCALIPVKIM